MREYVSGRKVVGNACGEWAGGDSGDRGLGRERRTPGRQAFPIHTWAEQPFALANNLTGRQAGRQCVEAFSCLPLLSLSPYSFTRHSSGGGGEAGRRRRAGGAGELHSHVMCITGRRRRHTVFPTTCTILCLYLSSDNDLGSLSLSHDASSKPATWLASPPRPWPWLHGSPVSLTHLHTALPFSSLSLSISSSPLSITLGLRIRWNSG